MIDWLGVLAGALWIGGLALGVATLGFARLDAQPLRQTLAARAYRLAISAGILLFALGMAVGVSTWYERAGWVVVAALTMWDGVVVWRQRDA